MDYILNGQASGSVASRLLSNNFDIGVLRPHIGKDGGHYITIMQEGQPKALRVSNANATLRRDEWKVIDDAVSIAARQRMRLISDLRGAGLTYNIPNGMGKTVLESARMGDITPATISMDPARKSEADRPEFDIINLPLPIIHKDFMFTARQIAVSRNQGSPLDTTTAELASRRVMEEAEKLSLGTSGTYSYGGGTVYGLINFPGRLTLTLSDPTDSGWIPNDTVKDLMAMRQKSQDKLNFGPWVLYTSPGWDLYMDQDYSTAKGDNTLRDRIRSLNGISDIRTLDFLPGLQLVLVQLTSDNIRLVTGMDVTTLQWETNGGMEVNFKVMAMIVPQVRADIDGNTGIVHGVVV